MTQRISRTGSHSGFTLLELMLALAIGGMVLSAVYNMFSVGVDTQRRVARAASQTQGWRFFAERLRSDLRNLLVDKEALRGDQSSVTLKLASAEQVRYERRNQADGGQIWRILIDEDDGAGGHTLVYEGVKQLAFRYLEDGKWLDRPGEALPGAVECTLQNDHGERRLVVALEVESPRE